MELNVCTYCGKTFDIKTMTPLFEKGNDFTLWYCDNCLNGVKQNIQRFTYKENMIFGKKGIDNNPFKTDK